MFLASIQCKICYDFRHLDLPSSRLKILGLGYDFGIEMSAFCKISFHTIHAQGLAIWGSIFGIDFETILSLNLKVVRRHRTFEQFCSKVSVFHS